MNKGIVMKKFTAVTLFFISTAALADLAPVTHVEPIIRNEPVMVTQNTCHQQPVYSNQQSSGGVIGTINDSIFGSTGGLVGAVVGGVVGSQIGGGQGRDLAKIAGVIIGAKTGDEYSRGQRTQQTTSYQTHCGTSYSSQIQQIVTGYRVTYIFDGRVQTAVLPYNPGTHVNVERTTIVR